jgi:DNA polymerase-3 subunit delta'
MSEMADLYAGVAGQDKAIAALTAAAVRPVHAYLLVGPPGTGKAAAARGFAAALLCPAAEAGGPPDGTCESCRRALAGLHPDVIDVEREGPAITIDTAREVTRLASTSPLEGSRKVLVLHDFHLVKEAGPALLKTIEEPPASTVFVILAEYVPPELVTIASRSVRIDFDPLTPAEVMAALEGRGLEPNLAAELASASGGRLDRALLLATDPGFKARREAWRAVPGRLDGTGATAAVLADDLVRLLDSSVEPLRARHEAERAALEERNAKAVEVTGRGGGRIGGRAVKAMLNSGINELENRQRREIRRQRTDELRAGLATLAGAYRDRLAAAASPRPAGSPAGWVPGSDLEAGSAPAPRSAPASEAAVARRRQATLRALDHIDKLGRDLQYNPGELLQLQALLMRLGTVDR